VPAQVVDELVARDRVHPGRQQLGGIVGVPLGVDRQQHLLHEILRLGCASPDARKSAFVVASQVPSEPLEQGTVGSRVAVETGNHQVL
jgi:hypothetical protein